MQGAGAEEYQLGAQWLAVLLAHGFACRECPASCFKGFFGLIDDLVNPAVLEHCVAARVITVGKRGGCRSTPQDFIHRLMLRYTRQGKCVVRLKGGDPCIFGRGGEEAMWLRERGVEVELVNGITAGLAGATNCAVPLTLRGVSRGVTLVTAHTQDDSSLNWRALAEGGTTLVVYMGVAKLEEIRQQLLEGAMAEDMPVPRCRLACQHCHPDRC